MNQYSTWHGGVGLGLSHTVLDGAPVPLPEKDGRPSTPLFDGGELCVCVSVFLSACYYCFFLIVVFTYSAH